ncbi:peptidyl-prolyl cis-trans isomerase [Cyclospora cayetanensis]|uniref:Peptidyl-prolyl cis-trans isomerase n=1 Tax=Cyclospora cayetanensis TaxID=88456 RepID=A0A1D3CZJ8_9EIME|nr:peptidyl-prolyl cis-trans isomerase [Cyclospora cayetanensis]
MAEDSLDVGVSGLSYAEALSGGSRPLVDPGNPGGDFVKGNGTGSMSIYGSSFPLEAPPYPESLQGLSEPAAANPFAAAGSLPHFRAASLCTANSAAARGSSRSRRKTQSSRKEAQTAAKIFITC